MCCAEGHLLGFGKEVVGIAVQHQTAQHLHGHQLFGNQLGRIEDVETERLGLGLSENLHPKLPFGECARFNPLPQVSSVKVGISP